MDRQPTSTSFIVFRCGGGGSLLHGLAMLALLLLGGCQTTGDARVTDLQPGERPASGSDEAGLWLMADRMEEKVRESGRLVDDARLNTYLHSILCRLSPDHCASIRVQAVQSAGFNATMSPNGHMLVWSGLLLRAANEAQLAYVLGHELSHYIRRHSVKRWRDMRSTTDAAAFFQIVTLGAGVGLLGNLGNLVAVSSLYGYSREQESEADELGFDLLVAAGYDPDEAPAIWAGLIQEREARKDPERSVFFATHPAPEQRMAAMTARVERTTNAGGSLVGRKRHREAIADHRGAWLDDEITTREFDATLVLLERLEHDGIDAAALNFARGEIYRLRRGDGDDARALDAYRQAIATGRAPTSALRSLAMVHWRGNDHAAARTAFQQYLQADPSAGDAAMIRRYIEQLEASP
jgi:predicted Zn-dependent protease